VKELGITQVIVCCDW